MGKAVTHLFTSMVKVIFIGSISLFYGLVYADSHVEAVYENAPEKVYDEVSLESALDPSYPVRERWDSDNTQIDYSRSAVAPDGSNSSDGDYDSKALSNGSAAKLTADPNENIDLFSGSVHLNYKDLSIPVAPGLNMDVIRSYSSEITDKFPRQFDQDRDMLENGWHFHPGYIITRPKCYKSKQSCLPIYVDSYGQRQTLFDEHSKEAHKKTFKSMQHLIANSHDSLYTMLDTKGNRYFFDKRRKFQSYDVRYNLARVESADQNHFINYHYDDYGYFIKITSSDPSKVIDIKYKLYTRNRGKNIHEVYAPSTVLFNDKPVIEYEYEFGRLRQHKSYTLLLKKAALANGLNWQYQYKFLDLRIKYKEHGDDTNRSFLTKVTHTNGEVTNYSYGLDNTIRFNTKLHGVRLVSRKHYGYDFIQDGSWQITKYPGPIIDNAATDLIKVKGPYHSTDYIYNAFSSGNLWRAGYLAEIKVYKDHNDSENNILQRDQYFWKNMLHTKHKLRASILHTDDMKDNYTHRAVLKSKIINRDGGKYQNHYYNFDQYDAPQTIIQKHAGKTRVISQEYLNIPDKNILGLRTKLRVNNKLITSSQYDSYGHITETNYLGSKAKYKYTDGYLAEASDAMGNATFFNNYVGNTPSEISYADGTQERYFINAMGLTERYTDKNNNTQVSEYNDAFQLTKSIPAQGSAIEYSYDGLNKIVTHGKHQLTEKYNAYYQQILSIDNSDIGSFNHYDALGRKVLSSHRDDLSTASPGGEETKYDSLGRVQSSCKISSVNNTSSCTVFTYLSNDRVHIQYPNGEYITYKYLAYGDPDVKEVVAIEQDARVTKIERDNIDYVTKVTQGDVSKYFTYDNNYNLVKYIEPETGVTEYKYDSGQKIIEKISNNEATKYFYNNKNYNLKSVNYSDESYNEYFDYDNNGNIQYSKKGEIEKYYRYDANNNLISEKLLVNDNINKNYELAYEYNDMGYLASITYPDKTRVDFAPTSLGFPTKIGKYISDINYYNNNLWSSYQYGNGLMAKSTLDEFKRVSRYQYGTIGLAYQYDNNNNLKSYQLKDEKDSTYNYAFSFGYDKTGRITQRTGPFGSVSYGYDSNDNVTAIKEQQGKEISLGYKDLKLAKVNLKDHLVQDSIDYAYDKHGNISHHKGNSYLYGLDGNLLTANGYEHESYDYDTSNNRIIKTNGDHRIVTFYSQSGTAYYEDDLTSKQTTKYIYFDGKKIAQNVKQGDKEAITYYHVDHVGSPVAMSDQKGNTLWREVYEPFGAKLLNEKNSSKFGFVGKEHDANGLQYFGARYYNPTIGRFMSPDPVPMKVDVPASFNRYAYSANNPYKYVDSDGRYYHVVLALIAGGVAAKPYFSNGEYMKGTVAGAITTGGALVLAPYGSMITASEFVMSLGTTGRFAVNIAKDITVGALPSLFVEDLLGEANEKKVMEDTFFGVVGQGLINPKGNEPKSLLEALVLKESADRAAGFLKSLSTHNKSEKIHNTLNNSKDNDETKELILRDLNFNANNQSGLSVYACGSINLW